MKVKAFRLAAYLLIAHFLIYVALGFLSQDRPSYTHLVVAAVLLMSATMSLFSPRTRRRGWLAVLFYAIVIFVRHATFLWVTLSNPTVPMEMKVMALVIIALIDSLVIAALILVFKPSNFSAFTSTTPSSAASSVQAAVSGATQDIELADRGHRLGAAMIDGIIAFIWVIPVSYATGLGEYALKGQQPPYPLLLESAVLSFAAFVLVNGYFLKKSGQTIGKKIVGIRIVDLEDKVPSLATLLGRRYFPIFFFNLVPVVGGLLALIDNLFIFRSNKRCIHDLIAKTRVILSGTKRPSATWVVLPILAVLILGILAGIAIPAYQDYQRRVQGEEAKAVSPAPAKPAIVDAKPAVAPTPVTASIPVQSTVSAPPAIPSIADEPEAIYAKFHSAGLAANLDEMLKHGTDVPDLASISTEKRQILFNAFGLLAQMLPKSYSVTSKLIDPEGKRAMLHLTAPGAAGTATLLKENGVWKVDNINWGESPKNRASPSNAKTVIVAGTETTKELSPKKVKEQPPMVTDGARTIVTVPESQHQTPPKNIITPKFNDVMTAVMRQDHVAVAQLLDLGWWVDKPDSRGFSPLMEAAAIGDVPMAELLLKHGANPDAVSRGGSPLQIAKRNRDSFMEALLRRYGATVE